LVGVGDIYQGIGDGLVGVEPFNGAISRIGERRLVLVKGGSGDLRQDLLSGAEAVSDFESVGSLRLEITEGNEMGEGLMVMAVARFMIIS